MVTLISEEGKSLLIPDNHPILTQSIFTQFDLNDNIPIPYFVLNFIFNNEMEDNVEKILKCRDYSKLLSLNENVKKCYIFLFSNYLEEIPKDIILESFEYITIDELHLIPRYGECFLNYQINLAKKNKDTVNRKRFLKIKKMISTPFNFNEKSPDYIKSNKYALSKICAENGLALQYASDEIKNDKNIVRIAVGSNHYAFEHASEYLKANKKFIIKLINRDINTRILLHVPDHILKDEEIIKWAFAQNEIIWVHSFRKIMSDKEFIIKVLRQNKKSNILYYANRELLQDEEFIKILYCLDIDNFDFLQNAGDNIKNDKEIIRKACFRDYKFFRHASPQLKNDKEFIKTLLLKIKESNILNYINRELLQDKEFVRTICNLDIDNFDFLLNAGNNIINDEEIITIACLKDYNSFRYASDHLKNNKDFIKRLLLKNADRKFLLYTSGQINNDEKNIWMMINR